MKEGFENPFPVKKEQAPVEIEKTICDIPESKIDSAIERVEKKKGIHIDKNTLVAIIEDIKARRDQGASFREARTFATRLLAGNQGEGYWTAMLSALGTLYSHRKKLHKEVAKSYKDFY